MVKSLINPSVDYPEQKTLQEEDKEYEASTYKVELLDEEVVIALGQVKYIKNILFYPIYLIKNSRVELQIGVYEIATWLRASCEINTYGFDLQTNTWKFSRQEDYVKFVLTWATL